MQFDFTQWPGLWAALRAFNHMDLLSYIQDPGYGYEDVYLFKGEFADGKYGLFIWDKRLQTFVEEPGTLEDYGFTGLTELYKKHPGLRRKK